VVRLCSYGIQPDQASVARERSPDIVGTGLLDGHVRGGKEGLNCNRGGVVAHDTGGTVTARAQSQSPLAEPAACLRRTRVRVLLLPDSC